MRNRNKVYGYTSVFLLYIILKENNNSDLLFAFRYDKAFPRGSKFFPLRVHFPLRRQTNMKWAELFPMTLYTFTLSHFDRTVPMIQFCNAIFRWWSYRLKGIKHDKKRNMLRWKYFHCVVLLYLLEINVKTSSPTSNVFLPFAGLVGVQLAVFFWSIIPLSLSLM